MSNSAAVLDAPLGMTQLNTRIERALKRDGDEALARAGLSTSKAVRLLWQFAANHRDDPQAVILALDAAPSLYDEKSRRIAAAKQGRLIIETAIPSNENVRQTFAQIVNTDDSDAYADELFERYAERGLL